MPMRVAVIGGGVAGLAAAKLLRERKVAVTLIDRSFPFGGRFRAETIEIPGSGRVTFEPAPILIGPASYEEHPNAPFELQPVSLRTALFSHKAAGRLQTFRLPHLGTELRSEDFIDEVTTPSGGARALIDALLPRGGRDEYLDLHDSTEVVHLEPDGTGHTWRVQTRECSCSTQATHELRTIFADAVFLTQPVPESLILLDNSKVACPEFDYLRGLRYHRGLALQAAFRGPSRMPDGGLVAVTDSPIAWLIENHGSQLSSGITALTALTNPIWAEEHWGESNETIANQLLRLVSGWAGGDRIWCGVRRWERHSPKIRQRMPFAEGLSTPPLLFAGDAFAGYVANTLDAAYTSAFHAADRLCRVLGRVSRANTITAPKTSSRVTLEVPVSSSDEAFDAVSNGADRLLLMAAPEVGGITPTVETFLSVVQVISRLGIRSDRQVPITVLLRPRLGGCDYTDGEFDQMYRDAERFLEVGAHGIAFGILNGQPDELRVDAKRSQKLVMLAHSRKRESVFHRAFDGVTDRLVGLQDLITIGIDRVITSGGWRLAIDGLSELKSAVSFGGWDLEIVAAGGITPITVGIVVQESGVHHVLALSRRAESNQASFAKRVLGSTRLVGHQKFDPGQVDAISAVIRKIEGEKNGNNGVGIGAPSDTTRADSHPFDEGDLTDDEIDQILGGYGIGESVVWGYEEMASINGEEILNTPNTEMMDEVEIESIRCFIINEGEG